MNARPFSQLDARGKQAALTRYASQTELERHRSQGKTFSEALNALTEEITTWLFTEHGERIA